MLAIIVVMACSISVLAGENPDCQVCIDFSGTASSWADVQSRVDPVLYEPFDAYICVYGINAFVGICFTAYVAPGVSLATGFTNLLPGGGTIGSWDTGVVIVSSECHTERFLCVAKLSLVYNDTPGDIMIFDHPEYARWVMDCPAPGDVDFYCVWMHGGVCKDALEGDEECFPVVPVEDATWGSVKALYR